jgi:hypothetical protein
LLLSSLLLSSSKLERVRSSDQAGLQQASHPFRWLSWVEGGLEERKRKSNEDKEPASAGLKELMSQVSVLHDDCPSGSSTIHHPP